MGGILRRARRRRGGGRTAPLAGVAALLLSLPRVGLLTACLLLFAWLARQDAARLSEAIQRALDEDAG